MIATRSMQNQDFIYALAIVIREVVNLLSYWSKNEVLNETKMSMMKIASISLLTVGK